MPVLPESSKRWQDLRKQFEDLLLTQQSKLVVETHPAWLNGHFDLTDVNKCHIRDGFDGVFRSRFREIASEAACEKGCPHGVDPVSFWIFCLARDREPEIMAEFVGDQFGCVQGLLEASIWYCSRQASEAIRTANDQQEYTDMERPSVPTEGAEPPTPEVAPGELPPSSAEGAFLIGTHAKLSESEWEVQREALGFFSIAMMGALGEPFEDTDAATQRLIGFLWKQSPYFRYRNGNGKKRPKHRLDDLRRALLHELDNLAKLARGAGDEARVRQLKHLDDDCRKLPPDLYAAGPITVHASGQEATSEEREFAGAVLREKRRSEPPPIPDSFLVNGTGEKVPWPDEPATSATGSEPATEPARMKGLTREPIPPAARPSPSPPAQEVIMDGGIPNHRKMGALNVFPDPAFPPADIWKEALPLIKDALEAWGFKGEEPEHVFWNRWLRECNWHGEANFLSASIEHCKIFANQLVGQSRKEDAAIFARVAIGLKKLKEKADTRVDDLLSEQLNRDRPIERRRPAETAREKILDDPRNQARRGRTRSVWLEKRISGGGWTSDLDIASNGGPTYNTIKRYRSGRKSNRDVYVRGLLSRAFKCEISEVPA